MAFKYREEIVGKRFLSVRSAVKLKLSRIAEWEWRAGVVRAATHKDLQNPELSVLVEFDDRDWSRREWIKIYENIFQIFLVENILIWGTRTDLTKSKKLHWPALNFKPLVDKAGIVSGKLKPIEFLQDYHLEFIEDVDIRVFKEEDAPVANLVKDYPEVRKAVKNWIEDQDGQKILLTTPSVLVGYRLRVYRAEGTTQWYTAVIKSYNDITKELTVVDDTVLEEHNEDPSLVQMKLIGDGVVDSILKGIDVGITPRRRSCNNKDIQPPPHYKRTRSQSPSHSSSVSRSSASRKPRQKPVPVAAPPPPQALPAVPVATPEIKEKPKPAERPGRNRTQRERKRKSVDTSSKPLVSEEKKVASPVVSGSSSSKRAKSHEKPKERPASQTTPSKLVSAPVAPVKEHVKPVVKQKEKRPKRHKPKSDKHEKHDSTEAKLVKKDTPVERSVDSETVLFVQKETVHSTASADSKEKQEVVKDVVDSVKKPEDRCIPQAKPVPVAPILVSSVTVKPEKAKSEKSKEKSPHKDSDKERHKEKKKKKDREKSEKEKVKKLKASEAFAIEDDKSCFEHDEETSRLIESIVESITRENRAESEERSKKAREKVKSDEKKHTNSKFVAAKPIASTSDDSGKNCEDPAMHFKKQLLLGDFKEKQTQDSLSAAINVNHSVTDQIAKLSKGKTDSFSLNGNNNNAGNEATPPPHLESLSSAVEKLSGQDLTRSEPLSSRKSPEHRTEPAGRIRNDSFSDERSSSRHSTSSRMSDDRRSNSRVDEIRRKGLGPSTSPLVFNKDEPVEPYRDPELLKKDCEVRHINSLQHAAMQRPHTHTPVPTTTYPNVHTPLTPHHSTMTAHHLGPSGSLLTPLHYTQQPMAAMTTLTPHLLPRASAQLDVASLAAHSLPPQQQAHLIQYPAHLLQQPQPFSFTLHGNVSLSQLEVLWQRKYPTIPVPPAWMLTQYQEELLRDVNLLRERELIERERIERDRLERERERAERERKEREKAQMEREQRERAEKERAERAERERQEQARKERERAEREQRERLERQRVLNESAAAAAAVNQHFKESLRLASQKISGMWGGPSITHGLPVKSSASSEQHRPSSQQPTYTHPSMEQPARDQPERKDQDREVDREDRKPPKQEYQEGFANKLFVESQQDLLMKQTEEKRKLAIQQEQVLKNMQHLYETQQKLLQDHLKSYDPKIQEAIMKGQPLPPEALKAVSESRSGHPYFRSTPQVGSGVHQIKQEPNFSLYGYQPFKHSYISQEKLQMHGLGGERVKEEKCDSMKLSPTGSDKKSDLASPPPLIKEHMKSGSSVIVENKMKDSKPINYDTKTSSSQLSPRQQHFLPHGQDRVRPPSTQVMSYSQSPRTVQADANMPLDYKKRDVKVSRPQSPLHVASPQQLSAAVMQPMELKHPGASSKTPPISMSSSSPSNSHAQSSTSVTSASYAMPTIAQPPVSLPASTTAFSYSLIQQGLVPNPLYSQTSPVAVTKVTEAATSKAMSVAETLLTKLTSSSSGQPGCQVPASTATAGHCGKRRSPKEGPSRKKPRVPENSGVPTSMPIPLTTPRIPTNTSPYTIPTMHTTSASSMPSTLATSSSNSSTVNVTGCVTSTACTSRSTGFMDSFKSFVENTVQNAFLEEQKLHSVHPKNKHKTKAAQLTTATTTWSPTATCTTVVTACATAASPVVTMSPEAQLVQPSRPDSTSAGSTSSLMETINRVANGLIDTDSDTLSAPSPPPQKLCDAFSPHKASAPKLKKAWLQRHSDEDKSNDNNSKMETGSETKTQVKDCYVNCSYISPTKEGEGKSPISSLAISNGSIKELRMDEDESTSSASETESQGTENQPHKRRLKSKRQRPNSSNKRIKGEKDGDKSTAKVVNNSRRTKDERSKESSEKTTKDQKSDEEKPSKKSSKELPKNSERLQPSNPESEGSECSNQSSAGKRRGRRQKDGVKETKEGAKTTEGTKTSEGTKTIKETTNVLTPATTTVSTTMSSSLSKSISTAAANKPLVKLTIAQLKKTMQPFLQNGPCSEVTPKLMKCRECKMTPNQRNKKLPNIFCRFYAFRRLRYSQKGFLTIAGFSDPSDAEGDDIALWMPKYDGAWHGFSALNPPLTLEVAKYIITHVGDKFCELVEQEKEAKEMAHHDSEELQIAWKRAVQGVREMCDVCDTTLFNMHWTCHKCGFVVCLDCYRVKIRKPEISMEVDEKQKTDDDDHTWLTCSANRQPHEPTKLMLTQIIPSNALWVLGDMIHTVREKWSIKSNCPCGKSKDNHVTPKNGVSQQLVDAVTKCISSDSKSDKPIMNGVNDDHSQPKRAKKNRGSGQNHEIMSYNTETASPLSILADVASLDSDKSTNKRALSKVIEKLSPPENSFPDGKVTPVIGQNEQSDSPKPMESDSENKGQPGCSTLRELLTKSGMKMKNNENSKKSKSKTKSSIDDIIQLVVGTSIPKESQQQVRGRAPMKLTHYVPKNGQAMNGPSMPIKIHTLTETSVLYPDVPHSWLCDGRLLRLHDPKHPGNLEIFQQQWKSGQPVLVCGCEKHLDMNVWRPESFSRQFGQVENDLVNCHNHVTIVGHPMKVFWDGFEHMTKRLTDDDNEPMLLKLKDWPPTEDFSDILPHRFKNLMEALPLPEYTQRYGILNLASRLPDFFVKPDLGPKMYNAYGSAAFPREGTTNLHIDVSDAVNLMVYVGVPNDDHKGIDHEAAALKAIDEAGCDVITKRRVREIHEKPGALWHIFDARDADKIRDLLNKVAKEQGETIEPDHDPIHDQSWYLDTLLRERLYKEYGVLGYPIVQCLGDAVFIPAGAPHQVRNLHSCIKCAGDFVSPEHLRHCFTLTHEFRHLSDTHTNHEDKLQVKNIIYHAVKDSVAILSEHEAKDEDNDSCVKNE